MIKSQSSLVKTATFAFEKRYHFPSVSYQTLKYWVDIVLSIVALTLLSPFLLLVAILIRIGSKGPVLFIQQRAGHKGKSFALYKFRTMYDRCESNEALSKHAKSDRNGVCMKFKNDPRVTKVGKILRKLSIDELPQLINVLKGEMSLVGPRPALLSEVAKYNYRARGRLNAVPGITGLWQISGRANLSFEEQIDLDLKYIKSANLITDIKIILLTIPAVVLCTGAY